jgi:hypothetical protein
MSIVNAINNLESEHRQHRLMQNIEDDFFSGEAELLMRQRQPA